METLNRCVMCKHEGLLETQDTDRRTVAGYTFQTEMKALVCPSCGEKYFALPDIGRFENQIATWLAEHGVAKGEAFRFLRKTLLLRAEDLGKLLDLTPETISRWEQGHRPPEKRAVAILASMVLDRLEGHDRTMQRLQSQQSPPANELNINLPLTSSAA